MKNKRRIFYINVELYKYGIRKDLNIRIGERITYEENKKNI